jgi:hypothetical protein
VDHGLPFSTWSLTKLAEFLVAEGVVDDISHEGLRDLLRKEGVSFQVIKTFKQSNDPDYEAKKNLIWFFAFAKNQMKAASQACLAAREAATPRVRTTGATTSFATCIVRDRSRKRVRSSASG